MYTIRTREKALIKKRWLTDQLCWAFFFFAVGYMSHHIYYNMDNKEPIEEIDRGVPAGFHCDADKCE